VPGAQAAIGLRSDIRQVIQAYVDYYNKHGGLAGRQIVPVLRSTDILDESDQNAACTSMVSDTKVYAVSSTAIAFPSATQCISVQGKTPMVNVLAPSTADQRGAAGYDVTEIPSLDRIYAEWASQLQSIGYLAPGDKIGLVSDNCDPNLAVVNSVLIPAVKAAGAGQVIVKVHDCGIQQSQEEMPGIVSYFASAGIQKILPADCPYAFVSFLQEAKAIAYHPKFSISDYCNSSADALAQVFDPSEFGGTVGITSTYAGGYGAHQANTPEMQRCSNILTAAGLPGVNYAATNSEAVAQCDYLTLLADVIAKLGPNPTRAGFATAIGQYGDYRAGFSPLNIYSPGKYSGGDLVHTIQFSGSCKCYVSTSNLRPTNY
jgi:ABC-type branched-subunit amino acid transport system substrate-binding protein